DVCSSDLASTASRLETHAAIRAVEHAIADDDAAHPTRHLAADHDAAVPGEHGAARDHDVLTRSWIGARRLRTGLDGDAVVADIDVAVDDAHVATRLGVDAVRVGGVGGILDPDAGDPDVVATV